jgi:CRISPR-associated protein Csy2
MSECPHFDHLLVIPRLRVQNANAISSPQTHGFPSMTAFLGAMWALERRTHEAGMDIQFNAVGVVCHAHQEQSSPGQYRNDAGAFHQTRNPIERDGSVAGIVQEGRIHLDLTLIFAVQGNALDAATDRGQLLAKQVRGHLDVMRIAGGSVVPANVSAHRQMPYVVALSGDEKGRNAKFQSAKLRWLPGSALVARDDLIAQRHQQLQTENSGSSRLDAWLSLSRINWHGDTAPGESKDAERRTVEWTHDRKGAGWIVPIPVGYGALSDVLDADMVANARDAETPFCFVESLYSMGEWLGAHRLQSPQQMLWYADSQPENGLYRCRNDYAPPAQYDFD